MPAVRRRQPCLRLPSWPTERSPARTAAATLPDRAPIPPSALGPAVNAQGYYVGRVEKNLYWITDGTYQAAFRTTRVHQFPPWSTVGFRCSPSK
ncbi:hypothetical protein [Streptomyces sp. 900105755]